MHNFQEETWAGNFGNEYTARNTLDIAELNDLYLKNYGTSREAMNMEFLNGLDRKMKILEVGMNSGNQLLLLQKMGFKHLFGIEINETAAENARKRLNGINVLHGSAFDIPFKDGYFDLVYTSGVLIHISKDNWKTVMSEMYRCSKKFIWGFEYFSDRTEEVDYRGNRNLLWKTDFAKKYRDEFPSLKLVKEKKYKYLNGQNTDVMFLLEK